MIQAGKLSNLSILSTKEPAKAQNLQSGNSKGQAISEFNILGSMDIMGATSGYTPEQGKQTKTTVIDESKMQLETELADLEIEKPVNQEITETELLEFDKMFDDFKKTKLIENVELEGVVRPKPISGNVSVAKTPSVRSGKNSPHKQAKKITKDFNEPVIRDGWLEISESSGILRRGTTFMSLKEIMTKCKLNLHSNFF